MCTVIVASRMSSLRPLWIAANRDEFLSRPSSGPTRETHEGITILAPVDLQAGGTWIGANSAGLLVAITNRAGTPPDKTRVSRGALVQRALRHSSLDAAAKEVSQLEAATHNPFHLILANSHSATLFIHHGNHIAQQRLCQGVHVITERSFNTVSAQRELWLRQRLEAMDPSDGESVLQLLRSHHDPDPIANVCIHLPDLGYGTRSSSVIDVIPSESQIRYRFADGPPCQTSYNTQFLTLAK